MINRAEGAYLGVVRAFQNPMPDPLHKSHAPLVVSNPGSASLAAGPTDLLGRLACQRRQTVRLVSHEPSSAFRDISLAADGTPARIGLVPELDAPPGKHGFDDEFDGGRHVDFSRIQEPLDLDLCSAPACSPDSVGQQIPCDLFAPTHRPAPAAYGASRAACHIAPGVPHPVTVSVRR